MMVLEAGGPNAEQIRYWNDVAGRSWVTFQERIDVQIGPLGLLAMDRAALVVGERVLDVGCGCGTSTVEIARQVGPTGLVLGLDILAIMLAQARQIARAAAAHARFENVDARIHAFPAASFDVLYSRFGVMFFLDPEAAFANLWAALRPGGRVAFVCWQTLQDNAWMSVPLEAALQYLPAPPPVTPGTPGPFAFADPERVRGLLTRAGFSDVSFEPVHETLRVGGGANLDETVSYLLKIGPTVRAIREADPDIRSRVAEAIHEALVPFHTRDGVQMPSASWIVTARRPQPNEAVTRAD